MSAGEELVDVVDEDDRVTGQATRAQMRAQNLRHRATYIFVFNPAGQLFVHKRAAAKDIYPSYYDLAAGGVVAAGESYDDGARRELEEELGIRPQDLRRLFPFRFADPAGTTVNGMLYSCTHDGPVRLQESEIVAGEWMDLDRVFEMAQAQPVCPDTLEALRLYLERLNEVAARRD
jgi:isopentenyldiphosphate isomerase